MTRLLNPLMLAAGLYAGVAMAAMTDDAARQAVIDALARGASADAIIEQLVDDGRSLQDATAIAVAASDGRDRIELARAGICASGDEAEAQQVGQSARDIVGPGAEDEIDALVALYVATECDAPPQTWVPGEAAGGGTPVSGSGTGGTRPPTFPGVRPPEVSPSN